MTHATVGSEDAVNAPEVTLVPTRRLVSHTGVDAARVRTAPEALWDQVRTHAARGAECARQGRASNAAGVLLEWLVLSVDVPGTFPMLASDLYPSIPQVRVCLMPCRIAIRSVLLKSACSGAKE